jgi:hypothetical protein
MREVEGNRIVWLKIDAEGNAEKIKEGGPSPGLSVLQASVGGYIERVPDVYLWEGAVVRHVEEFTINQSEQLNGGIVEMYCHEEASLALYALQSDEERVAYVQANRNRLSHILEPHTVLLGDVVICLVVVEK